MTDYYPITLVRDPGGNPGDEGAIPCQVVVRNEILFIGRRYRTTLRQDRNEKDIPIFWKDFFARNVLGGIPDKADRAAIGIYCNWNLDESFDVLIGAQVSQLARIPKGMVSRKIAPAKFMMFTVPGNSTEDILKAWKYIYQVWMPASGYDRGFSDDFDLFDDRFMKPGKPESEIYIPIL